MQVASDQAAYDQLKDMHADALTIIGLIAEKLCIAIEPHQSFNERLLEAATRAGREPWTAGTHRMDLERGRQIIEKGYEALHDDQHVHGEIAALGIYYALKATYGNGEPVVFAEWLRRTMFPDWEVSQNLDRKHMLVKAGALFGAEYDRLDRLEQGQPVFACGDPLPPIETEVKDGERRYHTVGKDGSKIDITEEINAIMQRHQRGNT